MCQSCGVHLIGSVALSSAEEVFRTVAGTLGPYLKRIPDGETGARGRWIWWQRDMLLAHPDMEADPDAPPLAVRQWDGQLLRTSETVRFKAGVDPSRVVYETGYAAPIIESYQIFDRLRRDGVIPPHVRYMVALPTPLAPASMYVSPSAQGAFLPAYERALLGDLAKILASIPHRDLSIQWDVCQEVLIYEGYFQTRAPDYKARVMGELHRLGAAIPPDVEMGYHLCYGSPRDEHLVMPKDADILTEMSNGIIAGLSRRLDYLHLPVPKDRSDDAYFAPLTNLRLAVGTQLYLGLLHEDDEAGDRARADAARRVVPDFGVATECGWGRKDPARVPGLIATHARAMAWV